jgi:UDP-glucose-4-epimerase GalE
MIRSGAAILVTGGAGYIGAHTCKALYEAGLNPIVYDNLSNGHRAAVRWGELVVADIRDRSALRSAMINFSVAGVINFAGLIEVARSIERPDLFYDINVAGLACVLKAMHEAEVPRIVFSSSAAIYGQRRANSKVSLLKETAAKSPISTYGDTKLTGERMIAAFSAAFGLSGVALRYFNAAGADEAGLIGEAHEPETHLIPLAIKAALGLGGALTIFGADFPTPDGSCIRDYVHVADLASAHVAALNFPLAAGGFEAMNLGTGTGTSVFEVIAAIDSAVGRPTPYSIGRRRNGDPARLVAASERAMQKLGWRPTHSSISEIVRSAAAWHRAPAYGAEGRDKAGLADSRGTA